MTAERLAGASRVFIDSNIFIYAVDGTPELSLRAVQFLQHLEGDGTAIIINSLVRAECLIGAIRRGDTMAQALFEELLSHTMQFPISDEILDRATLLAAHDGLKLLDAIHAATGMICGCDLIVTNDQNFADRVRGVDAVLFSAIEIG